MKYNLIHQLLRWYFSKNSLPYWCVLIADSLILFVCGIFTYWLFNKTMVLFEHRFGVIETLLFYLLLSLIGARVFSTYSGIVRYSSFADLLNVAYANALTFVLALCSSAVFSQLGMYSLCALTDTQTLTMFFMATLAMWALRVLIKALFDITYSDKRALRVLIYGALNGGVAIGKSILVQRPRRFLLCGFISHDERAPHMRLMGKHVYNISDDLAAIIRRKRIEAVVISPLRISEFRNNQEIQNIIIGAGCKIFMAQQAQEADVKDGRITDGYGDMQIHEVSVEDLLPRSEIVVDLDSVADALRGQRILITGSAGSIGSEIVRQVASFAPASMLLIDQAETPEHDIRLMMSREFPDVQADTVVTNICNQGHMEHLFSTFRPDYVFHAAAYKHVPMMEDNPSEAILNNVYGTKVIADLCVKYGVKKFVMVSTDKAVNPTNVMGCSKRLCEIYVQSLSRSQSTTQFVTTRFGNVLGSNGSVIPLFREQIRQGGPVTVTDERIVRFFMLIPEACKLVLEAGTKGHGGEIFVFDMGQPVKIVDLARRMIQLSRAKHVEIRFTGLRPGEKLYEEVLNELEGTKPSFHEKIRIATVREYDYADVSRSIDDLIAIARRYDDMETVRKMKEIVPEYKSNNSIYEKLDH